jgi:hypothetical protein
MTHRYGHMPFGSIQVLGNFFDKWVVGTKVKLNAKKITGEFFNRSEYAAD